MKNVHKHTIQGHQTKLLISSALELHIIFQLNSWLGLGTSYATLSFSCMLDAGFKLKKFFHIFPADTNSSHSTTHSHKKADGSSSNNDNGSSCKWSVLWREYVRSETDV